MPGARRIGRVIVSAGPYRDGLTAESTTTGTGTPRWYSEAIQ